MAEPSSAEYQVEAKNAGMYSVPGNSSVKVNDVFNADNSPERPAEAAIALLVLLLAIVA